MTFSPRRFAIIALFSVAFVFANAGVANALVLNWDSAAWAPGDLVNSYDLNGDSVNDVTVTITSQQANIWALDPTSGSQAPVVNQSLTGGLLPAENSLMLAANLHTKSACTMQISFTGGNGALNTPGASNVSFTLFDIDITTNADVISNIYGLAPDGTHIAATLTNVGSAVTVVGTGLTAELNGNAAAANDTSDGNVTISFGSALITDVFFNFGNTAGAPRYQDIGIGDISFTPVPEINPGATAAGSCLVALGLTVFARRRAQLRARGVKSA